MLNVVDDVTRKCLAAVRDTSISGHRVVSDLTRLIAQRGKPGVIVGDNGTELTSNAVLAGMMGPGEQRLIEKYAQHPSLNTFDIAILHRQARRLRIP